MTKKHYNTFARIIYMITQDMPMERRKDIAGVAATEVAASLDDHDRRRFDRDRFIRACLGTTGQ